MADDKKNYLKRIYVLLGIGGSLTFFSIYVVGSIVDPFSWSGWWVANGLHTLGGAYAFFFTRAIFRYAKLFYKMEMTKGAEIVIFLGGALILGVFWEWYELIIDGYEVLVLGLTSLATYADNIGDLAFDLLGALLATFYYSKYGRR